MSDDGEVQGGVIFSCSASVFVEIHVQYPMNAILDAPARANRAHDEDRVRREGGDIEAKLAGSRARFLVASDTGDFDDAAQTLPFGMTLGEPGSRADAAISLLDSPVSGIRLTGVRRDCVGIRTKWQKLQ